MALMTEFAQNMERQRTILHKLEGGIPGCKYGYVHLLISPTHYMAQLNPPHYTSPLMIMDTGLTPVDIALIELVSEGPEYLPDHAHGKGVAEATGDAVSNVVGGVLGNI